MNGFSVIPGELSNNIPVLRNREMQPLTRDARQPQDVFSEMQRRNGLDIMMGMQQQQARLMAGINNVVVRGAVHCGDQFPGASNPVKMRYTEVQKFNTLGETALKEDGEQRSKGDVGRQVGMSRSLDTLYHT